MLWIPPALSVLLLTVFQDGVTAVSTWPAPTDELEDLLFINSGYRARGFATPVIPCSKGISADRTSAAEWIRTAFHDMASGDARSGKGGLDASILYELASAEHIGAAFYNTLTRYAPYFSSRTSLADLIAAGVYSATRSCGGPSVPVRGGRMDATVAGPIGQIPDASNAIGIFKNQFTRMGFAGVNNTEMIQLVACGHTLGGVHASEQPAIINTGVYSNNYATFDTTVATFDNKCATEFISGNTKNPMVFGKVYRADNRGRDSDRRIFNSDGNVTIKAMQDSQTFNGMCRNVFQKMIETVPKEVTLSDIVMPYDVKPYDVQLTLLHGGASLGFTGEIRVKTTSSSISKVQIAYKDRTGVASSKLVDTTLVGTSSGFDDNFSFYSFSTNISAESSISSFDVVVSTASTTQTYTNNDKGYAVDDNVIFQFPQSCADSSGKLTVVAAIRDSTASPSVLIVAKVPRASPTPVPSLSTATVAMLSQSTVGHYTLYSADCSGSAANAATFGVFAGSKSDDYKEIGNLPTTCGSMPAEAPVPTTILTSMETSTTTKKSTSTETPTPTETSTSTETSTTIEKSTSTTVEKSTSSEKYTSTATPAPTPSAIPLDFLGCYTDSADSRALMPAELKDDDMTVEKCATFCNPYKFFGLEYGRECYCGNVQSSTSVPASASDCNIPCKGDSTQTCGAGQRLSLYRTIGWSPPVNPPVDGYEYFGCYSESSSKRALSDSSTLSDSMTVQMCAESCQGSAFFGLEFGRECYCGSAINNGSIPEQEGDCSLLCPGNQKTLCGAAQRLSIYRNKTPPVLTSPVTTNVAQNLSFPGYTYTGCVIDTLDPRALSADMTSSSTNSYAYCSSFCSGYPYFGVEYGKECYCSWVLPTAVETRPDSDCNMACAGSSTQSCGGPNRVTVFKSDASIAIPANPTIPNYGYKGCYTDNVYNRVLTGSVSRDDGMTVERCASMCSGSHYFGTQYGNECYCGDELHGDTKTVDQGECSAQCKGNGREFCGANSRLSLYESMDHVNATVSGQQENPASSRLMF